MLNFEYQDGVKEGDCERVMRRHTTFLKCTAKELFSQVLQTLFNVECMLKHPCLCGRFCNSYKE